MWSETEFASASNVNRFAKDIWVTGLKKYSKSTVPVTYELRDLLGESIKGRFHEPEIQRVLKSDDERFVVDHTLKTRKRDGKIQYLVSWKGYLSKWTNWRRYESFLHDVAFEQFDGLLS